MKKVVSFLLVTVIIFSLSACGKKSAPPDLSNEKEMIFAEFEWPDTDIAKLMPVPKSNIGNIYWSKDYGFVIYVANTSASDYAEYVTACEEAGFTIDGRKGDNFFWADNEDGYTATVRLQDDDVMFVRIDDPEEDNTTSEELDSGEEERQETPDISPIPSESEAPSEEPSMTEPPSEKSPPTEANSLTYSTNTFEQAKKGNSGIFSYKQSGPNYDIYWIIDFDDGYAYFFTFGNENGICDRVKIDDEGDLNSYITVTYHSGDDTWQYGFCFKRVRQPDRLIQSEADGTQYEFIATNLNDALKIRDGLDIVDY